MKNKIKNILIIILLLFLLILNYSTNCFGLNVDNILLPDFIKDITITTDLISKNNTTGLDFKTFQSDSEYLVLSEIYQDKYNADTNSWGLAKVLNKENNKRYNDLKGVMEQYDNYKDNIGYDDYLSQFGLQGHFFSFLHNKIHIPLKGLNLICSISMGIVVIVMCYFISKKYNRKMGIIFYITFLLSPWIVAFARNLYWVEFTWFLPVLFGLIISMNLKNKKYYIPCIFISIFIKCLCGYEYITTIMLMTISFLLIDLFIYKEKRRDILKTIVYVGITCLLAFGMAICIHSFLRGNGNILEGLKIIYDKDVLRRTIIAGSVDQFGEQYTESLNASVSKTLVKYIFEWRTGVIFPFTIFGIIKDGNMYRLNFFILVCIDICVLVYELIKKNKNIYKYIVMFVIFLATSISWYILGKSHSFIHTHINFVLWYFGFVQICIYIFVVFIMKCINYLRLYSKNKREYLTDK